MPTGGFAIDLISVQFSRVLGVARRNRKLGVARRTWRSIIIEFEGPELAWGLQGRADAPS